MSIRFYPFEFTVTRQKRWSDSKKIVEVSQGSLDWANPDCYPKKYPGEMETYIGSVEAVEAAIKIAEQWRKDSQEPIYISLGCTHGFTADLDEKEATPKIYETLKKEAKEFDQTQLKRCAKCGEIIAYERLQDEDENEFCSEYCLVRYWEN